MPPQHGLRWLDASVLPARCKPATIATRSPSPSSRPDDPFRPNGTVKTDGSGCCGISPLELGAVDPDAMQDHRHLAGDRDARLAVS